MTNSPVDVITSVQRSRRWSRAEKEKIIAVALEPGAVASEVARAAGIHTSQMFRWRRQLRLTAAAPSFSPVAVLPERDKTASPIAVAQLALRCQSRLWTLALNG